MDFSRRAFMGAGAAFFAAASGKAFAAEEAKPQIQGFDEVEGGCDTSKPWEPFSDKKVRVAIAGEGVCSFGSQFAYQSHPNAEVVACTDLDPARCRLLQERTGAKRTYKSCEELLEKEKEVDAIYIATDAPSHFRLATAALKRGLHVVSAVPALFGEEQLQDIPAFLEALKASERVYQMNETTAFRPQCFEMRNIYEAGGFGEIVYTEGEYFHLIDEAHPIGSYNGWRDGLPPQYYPTHSNGFYTCVTHKRFTEVTCSGLPSQYRPYKDGANRFKNPYGTEVAFFRCETGATARMTVAWDLPGYGGELGRCFGEKGCFRNDRYSGLSNAPLKGVVRLRPRLPPGVNAGGHGGSHAYLTDDFLRSILLPGHKPCVDAITALNTTVAGIYAHMSAKLDGATLKIPAFAI